jgi:hypothetical protein
MDLVRDTALRAERSWVPALEFSFRTLELV